MIALSVAALAALACAVAVSGVELIRSGRPLRGVACLVLASALWAVALALLALEV